MSVILHLSYSSDSLQCSYAIFMLQNEYFHEYFQNANFHQSEKTPLCIQGLRVHDLVTDEVQ